MHSWGAPFIYETYTYHISRLDHRHNFSPYFYPIYLSQDEHSSYFKTMLGGLIRFPLASFVPQMGCSIGTGFLLLQVESPKSSKEGQIKELRRRLPMAWFIQTILFVTFNKVITSQVITGFKRGILCLIRFSVLYLV